MGQMQTNRFTVFQNILSLYGMELGHPVTRSFLCQSTPSSLRYGEESDRQTYIHTHIQTDRQTDKHSYIHTYIHTYIHAYILYCIVLYLSICIAPLNSHGQTEVLLVQLAPRKETSFKKDVKRFDDKREARAEGGRRFQREGETTAKDLDMAMVVLVRGTKSSRLSRERRGRGMR